MSSLGIFNKETKTYKKVADLSKTAVIDEAMSDSSTNPVQNNVIKEYVDKGVNSSKKLQTYKYGSTTETYGDNYTAYAQWTDNSHLKIKCDNYIVETDYATSAGSANTVNGHTVNADVPSGAKFTDTVYDDTGIQNEINTLKKSVSDGKTKVANAITDKGVETATDASFDVMAENISKIETGGGELHGATLAVSTEESTLFGQTVTLTLGGASVATTVFADNGTCSFTDIQKAGTYSLYSTDGTDSNTITVDVTAENVINKTVISCEFYLTPDGETVTPVNDVAILLKCAEIKGKSYTTMDELLADEQAMGDITMSENAMKYLVRSTGFADAVCANETFMTLLGQSAYVDATVLNSDLWLSKLRQSPYWKQVADITVTIYGGASETITISGLYNSPTVTTNSSGSVSYSLIKGTYTFTGGVSGQSFTRTVTSSMTNVYVMPEHSLYWYGNIPTWLSGGLRKASNCTYVGESGSKGTVTFNSNNIYIGAPAGQQEGLLITNNKIDLSKYNKLFVTISDYNGAGGSSHGVCITQYNSGEIFSNGKGVYVGKISLTANFENEIDISQYSDVAYLYFVIGGGNFMNITAIRLE